MKLLTSRRRKVIISITSLIDVVLLLLIFFMLTSNFVDQSGIKLDLPESSSTETMNSDEITIQISSDGILFLNGEEINENEVEQKLKSFTEKSNTVVLKADKTVHHGQVVKVMDIIKKSGLQKIVIASQKDN
ncbi:MAG: biopolymer transporter ExbD [Candidatus Cloacimonetes bacterium]|nr:biopolymer transporter ExbD [Candidatus Cloacimonadota bacterium]